ncbi:hypothetical protein [Streptomyces niveus]|uniref:hypothetical protein n=1 Tax=Streptomyces niveus TaxID=193462 RepID=UPI0036D31819
MAKNNKRGRRTSGDPRKTRGDIAGPGGPRDRNSVIVDTSNAILLDGTTVSLVETTPGTTPVLALLLEGRINQTTDRARNLYLMDGDGAAAIVSELVALAYRTGHQFGDQLMARIHRLIDDGATGQPEADRE